MSQSNVSKSTLSSSTANLSMIKALDGLTSVRAMMAIAVGVLLAFVLSAIGGLIAMRLSAAWLMAIFVLLAATSAIIGFSAAGFLTMDKIKNQPLRSLVDALFSAAFTLHRLLGMFLLTLLVILGAVIAVSVLLAVCMIPGIGSALYILVFPASVLLLGIVIIIFCFVVISVVFPSLWEGDTIVEIMAKTWALAKYRSINLMINYLLLLFIVAIVNGVILSVLFTGTAITATLSGSILKVGAGFSPTNVMQLMSIFSGESYGGSYIKSGLIGGGLLYVLAAVLPIAVMIHGICINYLQAKDGIDFAGEQLKIEENIAKAKEKANEAKERAEKLNKRKDEAVMTDEQPESSQENDVSNCPKCKASLTKDDVFCGECGFSLK